METFFFLSFVFGMFIFWPFFSSPCKQAYKQEVLICKIITIKGKGNKQTQANNEQEQKIDFQIYDAQIRKFANFHWKVNFIRSTFWTV